ncbi:hypothetical protein TREMEDRAFT_35580, partial [Tremella mesenterica DSM 1558]|uniref:uncharacterized protein n=1 Tax=Tremella mesenterica (strain ATCC 24925 / CBS 8224 / DSM 1558 / NBRC 9311 / NRRL Y-6157 / RJB 2259-6 / UBC 559-6) TaxID=578456 RepID=UPI00032BF2E3
SPSLSPIPSLPPLLPPQIDPLPTTTPSALSLLKSSSTPQSGLYILARLHSRTYLLHPRDILTLPTLKPVQEPGTKLSLTRILEVGSREHSIRSPAADGKTLRKSLQFSPTTGKEWEYIPDWIVKCQVTVLEHTKSPMERLIKKKRRKGYKKTIEHKQGWTRLRVGDIVLGDGVSPES